MKNTYCSKSNRPLGSKASILHNIVWHFLLTNFGQKYTYNFFAPFLTISFSSALNEKSDQQQLVLFNVAATVYSLHQAAGAILTRELDQKHNAPGGSGCCYGSACSIS